MLVYPERSVSMTVTVMRWGFGRPPSMKRSRFFQISAASFREMKRPKSFMAFSRSARSDQGTEQTPRQQPERLRLAVVGTHHFVVATSEANQLVDNLRVNGSAIDPPTLIGERTRGRLEVVLHTGRPGPDDDDAIPDQIGIDLTRQHVEQLHLGEARSGLAVVEQELVAAGVDIDLAAQIGLEQHDGRRPDPDEFGIIGIGPQGDAFGIEKPEGELQRKRRVCGSVFPPQPQEPPAADTIAVDHQVSKANLSLVGQERRPGHPGMSGVTQLLDDRDLEILE